MPVPLFDGGAEVSIDRVEHGFVYGLELGVAVDLGILGFAVEIIVVDDVAPSRDYAGGCSITIGVPNAAATGIPLG